MNANVDVQCWVQTFVDAFAHQTTCSDESMGEGGRMDLLTGKNQAVDSLVEFGLDVKLASFRFFRKMARDLEITGLFLANQYTEMECM